MTKIHQLRSRLETAQAEYLSANIEHPTALLIAKDELTNARFDYWAACADLVTRLPADIEELQKDAERYRWLCNGNGYFMEEEMLCGCGADKASADLAIDVAMLER